MFPYRYRVLIFLFFLNFILYVDRVAVSLLGVRIKTAFGLSNEQFGWVLGAFSLAYAVFEIPTGVMGDRIGQKRVFIRIVIWWSLFTAFTGLTAGLISLIIVRFLFGMGEAGAMPTLSGVVSRWFPHRETARSFSYIFVGQGVGAAVAPLFIIPLASSYGWRVPFFVSAGMGIAWVLVCIAWFKNHPAEMRGIPEDEKNLIEQSRRFEQHKMEFPWKLVLRNRSLMALVLSFFCGQCTNYFFIAWMPVYLQNGKHFSENDMKLFSFYFFTAGIVGILVGGIFIDWLVKKRGLRFGRKSLGVLGLLAPGIAFLIAASTNNNETVGISLFTGGFIYYTLIGVTSFAACVDIGGSRAGTVTGIMNFFGQAGAFVLAMTFGKIADLAHNFDTSMFLLACVVLLGSMFWFFVDASKPLIMERIPEIIL
jgi:ACS family glucarate transporter-like MFS transporter